MKLYFSKGACSLVARIIIHEIGLKAEFEAVDLQTKKTQSGANFYQINPKGAVPALITNNNDILTENSAILQFLADSNNAHQLLPAVNHVDRYRVLEWLGFINSDVHKGFSPLFNPNIPDAVKEKIFLPNLKAKFDFIEKQLAHKQFLTGETFTLPDAYMFVMLMWLSHFTNDLSQWPNLSNYYNKLKKRKAISQALTEEGFSI